MTPKQEQKWLDMLHLKGRIPWVETPVLCALCGENWPKFFKVPDRDWDYFVIPPLQKEVLCRGCYDRQLRLFPYGWRAATQ
jgi:hypothetical protein